MAFNNWPYTNFQDLNLGWILARVKEAVTRATEALSSTTGFDGRIATAEANSSEANTKATTALSTANSADGKATEALSTANNASDTANAASANATQASVDATRALREVGSAIGSYKIFVDASNHCRYNEELIDAVDILSALQSGRNVFVERVNPDNVYNHIGYKFAYYDIDNSTTPATATVFFDRLISYAGENAIVERMYIVGSSNTAGFTTIQTLASKSYVDSHSGGGGAVDAVLYTAQTLTSAQKTQARSNIGAGKSTVTVSNSIMTIVDADTGSQTAYPIGGTGLPDTTNANADDFLMLDNNKNPAWVAVPNAANVSFGGV
jgi:hypothetical protein